MTDVFNGVASALNGVFGAPVTHVGCKGGTQTIPSIFRATPVEVLAEDGRAVIDVALSWRVPADKADSIGRGDEIFLADGRRYRVLNRVTSGSPASDGFVIFEMEEVPT